MLERLNYVPRGVFNPVILLIQMAALLFTSGAGATEYDLNGQIFSVFPSAPSVSQPIFITTPTSVCGGFSLLSVEVNAEEKRIMIALREIGVDISPCVVPSSLLEIPIEGITEEGIYDVDFFIRQSSASSDLFADENFAGSFAFSVDTSLPVYYAETPIAGKTYSGVGVIRGWACNASTVEVQFNDAPRLTVAYGSSRPDTRDLCGDATNGYGMVFAWGNLGNGAHIARTFIDGVEVSQVGFTVSGLDEPFINGLSAEYVLENFPLFGESVVVRWSQPDQNFIIVEHSK